MRTFILVYFWISAIANAGYLIGTCSDSMERRVGALVKLVMSVPFLLWAAYLLWS